MIVSEVMLIVGVIAVATFGFLNGWLARRLFAGAPDLSVDDVATNYAVPSTRWANGPRAVLLETRELVDLETAHDQGVAAVATFDRESDTQPLDGDDPDSRPVTAPRLTDAARDEELERRLADREAELEDLRVRVGLLDPLVERLRERDEWLTDLRTRHGEALIEKDAELSRCESRIADLETTFAELEELATSMEEVGSLRRRVAEREDRGRADSRRRAYERDDAPSMSAISGLA